MFLIVVCVDSSEHSNKLHYIQCILNILDLLTEEDSKEFFSYVEQLALLLFVALTTSDDHYLTSQQDLLDTIKVIIFGYCLSYFLYFTFFSCDTYMSNWTPAQITRNEQ